MIESSTLQPKEYADRSVTAPPSLYRLYQNYPFHLNVYQAMGGVCSGQWFMVLVYVQESHLQQKTVKGNLQMSLEQQSQMNLSRGVQILNEGDFDTYVSQMRQPHVWGGEPELLMSSHVLQVPITVHMLDKRTNSVKIIAEYGQEYGKENPIRVFYHGYGHYDALRSSLDGSQLKLNKSR